MSRSPAPGLVQHRRWLFGALAEAAASRGLFSLAAALERMDTVGQELAASPAAAAFPVAAGPGAVCPLKSSFVRF